MSENVVLISSQKNWMEQSAKDQLGGVSRLPNVIKTVGLPDLHAGKSPVGIALLSEGRFYPHLLGNDIGCGMALFQTGAKLRKYKQSKWVNQLEKIQDLLDLPMENPYTEKSPITNLGTIGSGNHFVEFQCIHSVENEEAFQRMELSKEQILMLIHSGSRGYGESILRRFLKPEGLLEDSVEAVQYLKEHDDACIWAERNRYITAVKLMRYLGMDDSLKTIIECGHNFLEKTNQGWLHRKGAVSAVKGPIVIPGSRGSLTYICLPKQNTDRSLDSLSHGAGRKWARSTCKSKMEGKYDKESIHSTKWKSRVICHDTNLLFQEAPEAYKNVKYVIESLIEYDLIEVIATLKPLITFKG